MKEYIVIIGYSGLVGNEITNLLKDKNLILVGRKKPNLVSENHQWISCDLSEKSLAEISFENKVSSAFICLGTTIKKAKTKEAFFEVDFNMVINSAKMLKKLGVEKLNVISSIGANKNSSNFYLQTKGKMEFALIDLNMPQLAIYRPSLLIGKRQENRFGEKMAVIFYQLFSFLFVGSLKKYKGTEITTLARFMIFNLNHQTQPVKIYENNEIIQFEN